MEDNHLQFEFLILRDRIVGDAVYHKTENALRVEVGQQVGNVVADRHWPIWSAILNGIVSHSSMVEVMNDKPD